MSFAQPISMHANIRPPVGFIGTTCGLVVLLFSMRLSNDVLRMGALALALSSTIFALVGYATLESLNIHLYGHLARAIDAGLERPTQTRGTPGSVRPDPRDRDGERSASVREAGRFSFPARWRCLCRRPLGERGAAT